MIFESVKGNKMLIWVSPKDVKTQKRSSAKESFLFGMGLFIFTEIPSPDCFASSLRSCVVEISS